jgi:hypothetical protein
MAGGTEIEALATRVVEVVALALLAAHGATQILKDEHVMALGRQANEQLQERLRGRAREALEDLRKRPDADDNRADLRKQLGKILADEPMFAAELSQIVPESLGIERGDVVINRVGSALNVGSQVSGSFNKMRIE